MKEKQHTPLSSFRTTFASGKLVWIFIIVSVLLTAVILYYGTSKTTLTITRGQFPIRSTFVFTISPSPSEDQLEGTFSLETLSHTYTYDNLTTTSTTDGNAEGVIRVINNWSQEQPLQATTRFVTSDGTLFRSTERVDIPAGGEALVPVRADEQGAKGEVEKGTRFTIPGLWQGLQDSIYGVAENDFSGGVQQTAVVTDADISAAEASSLEELDVQAKDTLATNSDPSTETYSKVIRSEILLRQASAQAGDTADELTYTTRARYVVISVPRELLSQLFLDKLSLQLTEDEEITEFSMDALTMDIEHISSDESSIQVKTTLQGTAQLKNSSELLTAEPYTGKDQSELDSLAEDAVGITSISASFSPFWIASTPGSANRILVHIH